MHPTVTGGSFEFFQCRNNHRVPLSANLAIVDTRREKMCWPFLDSIRTCSLQVRLGGNHQLSAEEEQDTISFEGKAFDCATRGGNMKALVTIVAFCGRSRLPRRLCDVPRPELARQGPQVLGLHSIWHLAATCCPICSVCVRCTGGIPVSC